MTSIIPPQNSSCSLWCVHFCRRQCSTEDLDIAVVCPYYPLVDCIQYTRHMHVSFPVLPHHIHSERSSTLPIQSLVFSSIPTSKKTELFFIFQPSPNSFVLYSLRISRGHDFRCLMKHPFRHTPLATEQTLLRPIPFVQKSFHHLYPPHRIRPPMKPST